MINKRLKKIASLIDKGMIVADIGTDHAFLPIYLVKNKICDHIIASDINENPLKIARENIKSYGYEDNIKIVLSDGLENIEEDIDVCVIAGMGFYTCKHIIESSKDKFAKCKSILIEINRDVDKLREYISDNNYTISNEAFVEDRNHDYIILDINMNYHKKYNEKEILCGPILKKKKDKEYMAYVQKQINKLETIISKTKDKDRIKELNKKKSYWEEI